MSNLTAMRGNLVVLRGNLVKLDARTPFIIEVDTALGNGFNTFTLPLTNHTTNIDVKVSDGQQFNISNYLDINRTINFASSGVYTLELKGQGGWSFNNTSDCQKVTWVKSWGNFYFNYLVNGFNGCINIGLNGGLPLTGSINAPDLTSLVACFTRCSLKSVGSPEILKKCVKVTNLSQLFRNNRLEELPEGLFKYNVLVTNFFLCFYSNSLTSLPNDLFKYNILATNFNQTLKYNQITSLPDELFKYNILATNFSDVLVSNRITYLPEKLFYYNKLVTNYNKALSQCIVTGTVLPLIIFDLSQIYRVTTFASTFEGIDRLYKGTVQPIWDYASPTVIKTNCFLNQTDIVNYDDIPNEWKGL